MKHIKPYTLMIEDAHTEPQIDDYVILNTDQTYFITKKIKKFINNKIGQIIKIINYKTLSPDFIVKYDNIPPSLYDQTYDKNNNSFIFENIGCILYISKDKEQLEALLQANKYNL